MKTLNSLAATAPPEPPHPARKPSPPTITGNRVASKYDHIITNTKLAATTPKASVEDRVRAYLEKVPASVSGEKGHNRLYHA
ncbi:MAG TPA: hypothetical protein VKP69_00285, partial [Isosphaeraceae bacterium]|nr:hypothetical protein [Isosphaeraceae bacterium]